MQNYKHFKWIISSTIYIHVQWEVLFFFSFRTKKKIQFNLTEIALLTLSVQMREKKSKHKIKFPCEICVNVEYPYLGVWCVSLFGFFTSKTLSAFFFFAFNFLTFKRHFPPDWHWKVIASTDMELYKSVDLFKMSTDSIQNQKAKFYFSVLFISLPHAFFSFPFFYLITEKKKKNNE